MKYEIAALLLWAIALFTTVMTDGSNTVTLPVFAICMIGTVLVVRHARTGGTGASH